MGFLFGYSREELKSKIEKKKGELEQAKINLKKQKALKATHNITACLNTISCIQGDIADLKAKLAKTK